MLKLTSLGMLIPTNLHMLKTAEQYLTILLIKNLTNHSLALAHQWIKNRTINGIEKRKHPARIPTGNAGWIGTRSTSNPATMALATVGMAPSWDRKD